MMPKHLSVKQPCCDRKDKDDKLAESTQAVIDKVKADPSASAKYCQDAVNEISNRLEQFNSYREALPSARAAFALNKLSDDATLNKKHKQPCVTMLSLDAKKLNTELGLPQEAGLIAENAQVRVLNAAGLHENSLARTGGAKSFDGLIKRTRSFSSEGEFLTFMNNTTDAQQQIDNAIFLRTELAGEGRGINPMKIKYRNPAMRDAYDKKGWFGKDPDPDFGTAKNALLDDMTKMIGEYQEKLAAGTPFKMFPPVRSGHHETIVDSQSGLAMYMPKSGDINANELNLAKMIQHQMSAVLNSMEEAVKTYRGTFNYFQARCGPA